jgi:FdhD protein
VVASAREVLDVSACEDDGAGPNALQVTLAGPPAASPRRLTVTSACGVCGSASVEAVRARVPWDVREDALRLDPAVLSGLPERLRERQTGFARTGGLHAAAAVDATGAIVCVREDVGRHNAVDKVVGWAARAALLPLRSHLLLVSGRASFELVQKALLAGIPALAAVSAPSSLAVELARSSGMTLVGFLRGDTMTVYAGAERIAARGLPAAG